MTSTQSGSGFYRFIPVSKELGLEPFKSEGVIWPSQKYYEKVARLADYIDEKLYVFTGLGLNPDHGLLEGIVRVDEHMLYGEATEPLYPHTLLLEGDKMINLSTVTHISLKHGFNCSRSKAVRAIFEGENIKMEGFILNRDDPSIIYRDEENIQKVLQQFKRTQEAVRKSMEQD